MVTAPDFLRAANSGKFKIGISVVFSFLTVGMINEPVESVTLASLVTVAP